MRNERKRVGESKSKTLCLPFYSILLAMGNPTVDYFSLDVEGAELQILKTIPWNNVDIKVMFLPLNIKILFDRVKIFWLRLIFIIK